MASSTIDGSGETSSTVAREAVVTGAAGAGPFRTRRVMLSSPTACARRIGSGCWFPPPPPPLPACGSVEARNTRRRRSGPCCSVIGSARRTSTPGADVVSMKATMTTRAMCSGADAASRVNPPRRRCGMRGVRGASGSRSSTTRRSRKIDTEGTCSTAQPTCQNSQSLCPTCAAIAPSRPASTGEFFEVRENFHATFLRQGAFQASFRGTEAAAGASIGLVHTRHRAFLTQSHQRTLHG